MIFQLNYPPNTINLYFIIYDYYFPTFNKYRLILLCSYSMFVTHSSVVTLVQSYSVQTPLNSMKSICFDYTTNLTLPQTPNIDATLPFYLKWKISLRFIAYTQDLLNCLPYRTFIPKKRHTGLLFVCWLIH